MMISPCEPAELTKAQSSTSAARRIERAARKVLGADPGDRFLSTRVSGDRLLEAGYVEDPLDLVADAAEREAAVELLPGPNDQGNTGRVDELAAAQVDDHAGIGTGERRPQLAIELRGGVHVKLALDVDDEDARLLRAANFERGRVQCSCDATEGRRGIRRTARPCEAPGGAML